MPYEVPDAQITQVFENQNPVLLPPALPSCLVGLCYQHEYREDGGDYSGSAITIPYPNQKLNAVVDTATVEVDFSTTDGIFSVSQFTANANTIDVDAAIALSVRVVENSQTGESTGIFFTDDEVNFYNKFEGSSLTNTATIVVSSPSDNQNTYRVQQIINKNQVRVLLEEDGTVGSGSMPAINSISQTMAVKNVSVKEFIVGAESNSISFTNTYSIGATVIDGEAAINQNVNIIAGDYIDIWDGVTATINKIVSVDSSTGAINLTSGLLRTTSANDSYRVFHPVFAKNTTLNQSGDYVIASSALTTVSENFYSEISSVDNISQVTLATALLDANSLRNTATWTTSDSYTIERGMLQDSTSNIYDAYLEKTTYDADVLVTYKARRVDLNDGPTAITGADDIESVLGPQTPDNPLGFAAKQHNAISNDTFYVMGVSADTSTGHQVALEILEAYDYYSFVPLSQDLDVIALYKTHVTNMSEPEEKMERIAFVNRNIYIADTVTINTGTNIFRGGTDSTASYLVLGMVNSGNLYTLSAATACTVTGVGYAAAIGDKFTAVHGGDGVTNTVSVGTVTAISADLNSISFTPAITTNINDKFQMISYTDVSSISDAQGSFTNITNGDAINLLDTNLAIDDSASVTSKVTLPTNPNDIRSVVQLDTTDFGTIKNQIFNATTEPLTKQEQAQYMRDWAKSVLSRRVVHVYAPQVTLDYSPVSAPTTEVSATVPGYFLAAGVAAMKSENTPSQPFTNLPLSLSTELSYSNTYFKPTYLDDLASGGNYIMVQSTPESFPYSRHQLTTDVTSVETQELSITSAIDWFAKFMRQQLRPYIGRFNITDEYLAQLKLIANGVIRKTVKDFGYLRDVKILNIEQSTTSPDEVSMELNITVLYPANRIRVTLYI